MVEQLFHFPCSSLKEVGQHQHLLYWNFLYALKMFSTFDLMKIHIKKLKQKVKNQIQIGFKKPFILEKLVTYTIFWKESVNYFMNSYFAVEFTQLSWTRRMRKYWKTILSWRISSRMTKTAMRSQPIPPLILAGQERMPQILPEGVRVQN